MKKVLIIGGVGAAAITGFVLFAQRNNGKPAYVPPSEDKEDQPSTEAGTGNIFAEREYQFDGDADFSDDSYPDAKFTKGEIFKGEQTSKHLVRLNVASKKLSNGLRTIEVPIMATEGLALLKEVPGFGPSLIAATDKWHDESAYYLLGKKLPKDQVEKIVEGLRRMKPSELKDLHTFIFTYMPGKKKLSDDKAFVERFNDLVKKYPAFSATVFPATQKAPQMPVAPKKLPAKASGTKPKTTVIKELTDPKETERRRKVCIQFVQLSKTDSQASKQKFTTAIGKMTPQEVNIVYIAIFAHIAPKKPITDKWFQAQMNALNKKYGIFG